MSSISGLVFIVMILLLNGTVVSVEANEKYKEVTKYDRLFSKYSRRYFGDHFEWLYFKAQAIAGSNLDEHARSQKGADGIMQIMPGTFNDIRKENPGIRGSLKKAKWNIAAGSKSVSSEASCRRRACR